MDRHDEQQRPRRSLGRGPGTADAAPGPVEASPGSGPAPEAAGAAPAGAASPGATTAPPAPDPVPAPYREPLPLPQPDPEPGPEPGDPDHVPIPGPAREPGREPRPGEPMPAPAPLPAPPDPAPAPEPETEPAPARAPQTEPEPAPVPAPETEPAPDAGQETAHGEGSAGDGKFTVRLANFEGPFDLLLQLISKHKMDVTEVALSQVTDEFMTHIHAMGPAWDLDQTTEFLVVAATLLDLKAARLLPAAEVEDEADLALLEARDLLFARLLQYRAYKQIAEIFQGRLDTEGRLHPRTVGLEPHHAELLPDVVISIGAEGFAKLAVKAMQPKPKPQVYVDHIHAPLVSVREQAEVVIGRLRELGDATFRQLIEDAPDPLTVVARFLALLELYREKAVALDQDEALGPLMVRWTGPEGGIPHVTDEFDVAPVPDEDGPDAEEDL